jgi:hypothetical protein
MEPGGDNLEPEDHGLTVAFPLTYPVHMLHPVPVQALQSGDRRGGTPRARELSYREGRTERRECVIAQTGGEEGTVAYLVAAANKSGPVYNFLGA